MLDIRPFKISIPDSELELLKQKLKLTRLPTNLAAAQWTESSDNQVTLEFLASIHKFWEHSYSWRDEEELLNKLPQFITTIEVAGFGDVDLQFVHAPCRKGDGIPLLFFHGWPGSIREIEKALPLLNEASFDVVAPSLPGWMSSTSPTQRGFSLEQIAECAHKLMLKLGHEKYILQGGDWGGQIAPVHAVKYPDHVLGLHLNYFPLPTRPTSVSSSQNYTDFEMRSLALLKDFRDNGSGYSRLQGTKPITLGIGLHDSPLGMLAWMADKLFSWSDCQPQNPRGYEWTYTEIITWTLVHYFSDSGPTTSFRMYVEQGVDGRAERDFVRVPTAVSAFPAEMEMVPRSWAETQANIEFWKEHDIGGHFAMYERPQEMVEDIVDFVNRLGFREAHKA